MRSHCVLLVLTSLLFAAVEASAQSSRFRTLSLDDGLSQSTVMATLTDREGYLWLATEDGLNRYDGYDFTVFKHDPADPHSLSDNYAIALHESTDGTLWVGTSDGGLNRRDPETGRFTAYRHNPEGRASLSHDRVTAIAEDDTGLWVGTRGGGLNRLDIASGTFVHVRHDPNDPQSLPSDEIWTLLVDQQGVLWVGTRGGGLARREADGTFTRFQHDPANVRSLPADDVLALEEDAGGHLWVGTFGGGLARLDRDGFVRYRHREDDPNSLPSNRVTSVLVDQRGTVWVGTWGDGAGRLDPATGHVERLRHDDGDAGSLPDDYVRSLAESPDASALVWVGTVSGGVALFDPAQERFGHVQSGGPGGLVADYVRAFAVDQGGQLWIGTRDGVSRGDGSRFETFTHEPGRVGSLPASYVRALLTDEQGTMWVGTAAGLARHEGADTFTAFPHAEDPADANANRVYALLDGALLDDVQDSKGNTGLLWIGTRRGLYGFDRRTERFVQHFSAGEGPTSVDTDHTRALTDDEVIALAAGADGALWAGTPAGLNRIDVATGAVTHYRHDPADAASLSNDRVFSIYPRAGSVWVGTNSGLNHLDPTTGTVRRYTEADGLPNGLVYGILEDDAGHLWLSTNRGLARFDPVAKTFRAYDATDGLQSNEFNQGAYHRAPDGTLLFGGIRGYNRFDPAAITDNPHVPPVVLTAFRVLDRGMLVPTDGLRLGHEDSFISFEFAALDFTNPARNQYAYRLEGFDAEWHQVGTRRYVSYTNLDGGAYVFRVRGSNNDGVWNEAGVAVPVTVVPPVWETWWFQSALVLAVLGVGFAGAWAWQRGRMRIVERSRDEIAEAKRRLAEGREQERLRLARDLHDGPLQNLYTAKLRLALAAEAAHLNGELAPVEDTLGQVSAALRGICGELRPPALGPFGLAAALRSHAEALRAAHPALIVNLDLAADGQRLPESVRLALFRIAQEALSNAARHAEARGVHVVFTVDAEAATLSVRDDGRGFRVPARSLDGARAGGFGLLGMTERAEALGGRLVIDSSPGRGTTVRVRVPLPEVRPTGHTRKAKHPREGELHPGEHDG